MKPMLCNTQVVKNILAGRQTQDRRPIPAKTMLTMKIAQQIGEVSDFYDSGYLQKGDESYIVGFAKYQPGDILYVRETWKVNHVYKKNNTYDYHRIGIQYYGVPRGKVCSFRTKDEAQRKQAIHYYDKSRNWLPSIHMPKWAARIFLKVTAVRVERIQDISWYDCRDEGIVLVGEERTFNNREQRHTVLIRKFKRLWESCYPGSWERNDWVFVYEFERCEKP